MAQLAVQEELHQGSLGRTGHHYNDGIAFKFEDDTYETVFRSIEWQTGRSGEIAPVAVFDTVEIDGCEVSRASLHNLTFIKNLELHPGCRILVSKRNMIIPHVEENLDRGAYEDMVPDVCPCCGQPTRTYSKTGDKGRMVETLHCDNPECGSRILQRFVHFAEKKAMNIRGLSEATLDQLIQLGALKSYQDLYHLDRYRDEITALEGFGEKSYENMIASGIRRGIRRQILLSHSFFVPPFFSLRLRRHFYPAAYAGKALMGISGTLAAKLLADAAVANYGCWHP